MGLTECKYLPEDVYAAKAISRISSTDGTANRVYIDGWTNASLHGRVGWREGGEQTTKWEKFSHSSTRSKINASACASCCMFTPISHLHFPYELIMMMTFTAALYSLISTYGLLLSTKWRNAQWVHWTVNMETSADMSVCCRANTTSSKQLTYWKEGGRESPMPPVRSRGGGSSGWLSVHWDPPSECALSARTN